MAGKQSGRLGRREFLKRSAVTAASLTAGLNRDAVYAAKKKRSTSGARKKVIVIGIDGMDPVLSEGLMEAGMLPNFNKLRRAGGYRPLKTSVPAQSPVAWANFINGANPGNHGIFAFVHREPENPCDVVNAISHIIPGRGIPVAGRFFVVRSPRRSLGRQGVPFWDYLDEAGISSAVYLMPSNYPPSRSKYGNHRSLSGLGTPDMLGSHGTYQYFTEDGPAEPKRENKGIHSRVVFKNECATAELVGPNNHFLIKPTACTIKFNINRDIRAKAAVIEVQEQTVLLKPGQWSNWVELDFAFDAPVFMPDKHASGICRFYLQQLAPTFRLYVSPIGINPANPAMQISEPADFSRQISKKLGLFYTVGFSEEFNARNNNVFSDEEYEIQTEMVRQERLRLLDYALEQYDEGLLFFYFSSTDLQGHMFWWDSNDEHPVRSREQAKKCHYHIKKLYCRMDDVLGSLLERYGNEATIIVLSDHGFSHLKRLFDVNRWLCDNGYIRPSYIRTLCPGEGGTEFTADWYSTRAYAEGVTGLYLNLKGREEYGIVKPQEKESLLQELVCKLEAVRDADGSVVISKVYRSDEVYSGPAMKYAPDLILGFNRGYRAPPTNVEGEISAEALVDNTSAWSADHCFAAEQIPGVLFSNRPIRAETPSLTDLAPSILDDFGLKRPATMEGENVFG